MLSTISIDHLDARPWYLRWGCCTEISGGSSHHPTLYMRPRILPTCPIRAFILVAQSSFHDIHRWGRRASSKAKLREEAWYTQTQVHFRAACIFGLGYPSSVLRLANVGTLRAVENNDRGTATTGTRCCPLPHSLVASALSDTPSSSLLPSRCSPSTPYA